MPPLRDRLNDIIPLAESFIKICHGAGEKYHPVRIHAGRYLITAGPEMFANWKRHSERNDLRPRRRGFTPDALGPPETDITDHSELQWPVQPAVHIAKPAI